MYAGTGAGCAPGWSQPNGQAPPARRGTQTTPAPTTAGTPCTTQVATDDQSAAVRLGETYVQCSIHAALTAPRKQRGNEGTIHFAVDLGPAAAYDTRQVRHKHTLDQSTPQTQPQMNAEVDIQRCIERALRDSGAVDQEALCVQPGRTVWALRVAVRVLDAAGNLPDACMLAALAALMAFRRPVVEVDAQGTLTLYAAADREPLPLSLHHLPVATTFASFSEVGDASYTIAHASICAVSSVIHSPRWLVACTTTVLTVHHGTLGRTYLYIQRP